MPARLLAVLLATPLLAACGASTEPSPASETMPACAEVWQAGETLPADYAGCVDEDGSLQVSNAQACTADTSQDGQAFATFGTSLYALTDGEIHQGAFNTPTYDELYRACFGAQW